MTPLEILKTYSGLPIKEVLNRSNDPENKDQLLFLVELEDGDRVILSVTPQLDH